MTDPNEQAKKDEKTFETVHGPFTLRKPSLQLQMKIHMQAARDRGGVPDLDTLGQMLNLEMATITVLARDASQDNDPNSRPSGFPRGFTWAATDDFEFLGDLFSKFTEWRDSFRKPKQPDADQAEGGGGGEEPGVRAPDADGVGAAQP